MNNKKKITELRKALEMGFSGKETSSAVVLCEVGTLLLVREAEVIRGLQVRTLSQDSETVIYFEAESKSLEFQV